MSAAAARPVGPWLALLALALVVWGVWPRSTRRVPAEQPAPQGTHTGFARLLLTADELGFPLEPWSAPLATLPAGGTLLLPAPERGLDEQEVEQVLAWAAGGGTLVYVADEQPGAARDDALLGALDLRPADGSWRVPAVPADPDTLASPVGRALVDGLPPELSAGGRWLERDVARGEPLLVPRGAAAEVEEAFEEIFGDAFAHLWIPADELPVARLPLRDPSAPPEPGAPGPGGVHVIASASTLRNVSLDAEGLALPLVRALALGAAPRRADLRARVIDTGAVSRLAAPARLAGSVLGRLVLVLLLGALLAAWMRALPLGAPRAELAAAGPSSLEHVRALADAWAQTRDEPGAARRVAQGLGVLLRAGSEPALAARLARLARREPTLAPDVELLLHALTGEARSLRAVSAAARRVRAALSTERTAPPETSA